MTVHPGYRGRVPGSVTGGAPRLVGVLAVQGGVSEHLAALTAAGACAVPVRRRSELVGLDAIVLPGGESTTMIRLLETYDLVDPLRAAIAGGLPTFGSCAGMILLADELAGGPQGQLTLGGLHAVIRRNAFGRQVDSFEADLMVTGIDEPDRAVHAVFIRAPWIEQASPDVQPLATLTRQAEIGGFAGRVVAARQGHLLVTAFHPELTGDHRLHSLFLTMINDQQSAEANR